MRTVAHATPEAEVIVNWTLFISPGLAPTRAAEMFAALWTGTASRPPQPLEMTDPMAKAKASA
jgi:hypothetical protein